MDESRSNGHERGRANWQSSISIRRNSMSQRPASPPRRPSDRLPPPREVAYPASCPLDGLTESRKPPSPPPSLPRHKMHPPHTSLPRPLHRDPPPPSFARVVSAPRKPQPPSRQKASLFERVSNPPPRRTSTSNTNPHVDHRTPPFSTASPSLPHTSTRNDKRERRSSRRVNVDDFDRSQKPKAKPAASPVKKPPAKLATASSARRPVADEVDCARASGVGSFDIDNSKYNFEFECVSFHLSLSTPRVTHRRLQHPAVLRHLFPPQHSRSGMDYACRANVRRSLLLLRRRRSVSVEGRGG